VAKFWRKGVPHAPAAENCTTCHGAHGSNHEALTLDSAGSLCAQCHDFGTPEFTAAHPVKPGPASCVTCHDPHGAPEKNLLYPVRHEPFSPGNCTPCHKG
jgi:predicted CXXCH cytochrome family protein